MFPTRSSTTVSNGKVVTDIYTTIDTLICMWCILLLVYRLTWFEFFLLSCQRSAYRQGEKESKTHAVTTINLSSFISELVWWTYASVHLTPSIKLMTELIQCKYDLPFRLTVEYREQDVEDKGEEEKKKKIKPRKKEFRTSAVAASQSGQLCSHNSSMTTTTTTTTTPINRTSLHAHIMRTLLPLSFVSKWKREREGVWAKGRIMNSTSTGGVNSESILTGRAAGRRERRAMTLVGIRHFGYHSSTRHDIIKFIEQLF